MGVNYNPKVVTAGLVLYIDAANPRSYPGTGNAWYDLSGNSNHFTLYNSPTFSANTINFNGVNQYAKTNATLNLASTAAITVISVWKVPTNLTQGIVYEHTDNWNAVNNGYGGFGIGSNTNGSVTTANLNHFQVRGNVGYSGVNTTSPATTSFQNYTVIHDFSKAGGEESYSYTNGVYQNNSASSVVTQFVIDNTSVFGNDYFYLASRGGTLGFCNLSLAYLAVYNRRLTDAEITQNYIALRGRFNI
jgi:hypothetical protein